MTRKNYEMIAGQIKAMRVGVERYGNHILRATFQNWVNGWVDDLKKENPNFDTNKFVKACELDTNENLM